MLLKSRGESFVNGKPEDVIHTSSPGRCSKVGEAFLADRTEGMGRGSVE
jgi:hypothetical protein